MDFPHILGNDKFCTGNQQSGQREKTFQVNVVQVLQSDSAVFRENVSVYIQKQ
jgi:hypothetical protein